MSDLMEIRINGSYRILKARMETHFVSMFLHLTISRVPRNQPGGQREACYQRRDPHCCLCARRKGNSFAVRPGEGREDGCSRIYDGPEMPRCLHVETRSR